MKSNTIWSTLIGIFLVFNSPVAFCYNENNHIGLTRNAFEYLVKNNTEFRCAIELGPILGEGAVREDEGTRPLNHFLPGLSLLGGLSATDWALSSSNNHNWNLAVSDAQSEEFAGWKHLGYVLHLLEDMSSPAHVRHDMHPYSTIYGIDVGNADPYEVYNEGHRREVSPAVSPSGGYPVDLMPFLQSYTQANNYSGDTVFDPSFPGPVADSEDSSYFYSNGKKIAYKGLRYYMALLPPRPPLPLLPPLEINQKATIDDKIAGEQFNTLAPLTVDYVGKAIIGYQTGIKPKMPTCGLKLYRSSVTLKGDVGKSYTKEEALVVREGEFPKEPSPPSAPFGDFALEWNPPIPNVSLSPMSGYLWIGSVGSHNVTELFRPISASFSCPEKGRWQGKVGVRRPDPDSEIEATSSITLTCKKKCTRPDCKDGDGWGDPHLHTFDRLAYDFQGAGEFILVKSLMPNDTFEVQVRTSPYWNSTSVSVTQAIAMNVAGDRVGFYLRMNPPLLINGTPTAITEGDSITLPSGGQVELQGGSYSVSWPDDSSVAIQNNGGYLNVQVQLPSAKNGQVIGLLGNADDNAQNDITTRDGVNLGTKIDFKTLYPTYADSWRISQQESLFDYASGETTETFTDRNFPRVRADTSDLPPDALTGPEQACRNAGITDPVILNNCILDVALTGQTWFARSPDATPPQAVAEITAPPPPTINDPGFGQLKGTVVDAITAQPLSTGQVNLLATRDVPVPGVSIHPITNGVYETDIVPQSWYYQLNIDVPGYIAEKAFFLTVVDRQVTQVEPVRLVPVTADGNGDVSGRIGNALDNSGAPNLNILARRYINQRWSSSGPTQSTVTDQNGHFTLQGLAAGNYTLEVQGNGYITKYFTVVIIGGQTQQVEEVISPQLGTSAFRIVLTWGEKPMDLDAHLTGPDNQGGRFHVYYGNRGSTYLAPYAYLDRDDMSQFGPETVTIGRLQSGDVYRYSVHDYSNGSSTSSQVLAQSNARVEVYNYQGLINTFTVPNQQGTLWTVFEIDGTGHVIPVNQMSYASSSANISSAGRSSTFRASSDTAPSTATDYWQILFQADKK